MIIFLFLLLSLNSCNLFENDANDPADYLHKGLAVAETNDHSIPYIVTHEEGEWMALLGSPNDISGVVYTNQNGSSSTFYFDNEGRVEKAYSNGLIALYDNYSDNSVDVSIIDEEGKITVYKNLYLDNGLVFLLPGDQLKSILKT